MQIFILLILLRIHFIKQLSISFIFMILSIDNFPIFFDKILVNHYCIKLIVECW
jgi:hypothetical protein